MKELKESIEWAIQQGGDDNYLLNDYGYPYIWGYYLHVVKEQRGSVMLAQTLTQLSAALLGMQQPTQAQLPRYNIDWDIRNSESGNFLTLKRANGEKTLMMGSFDFDTPDQGAERWLKQIKNCVAKGLWTTQEESEALQKEIHKEFQDYFDLHCSDTGDCAWKTTCQVRWAGGYGLRGCRRENPDDEMWK